MSNATFADLGVSKPVAVALKARGITSPFPVQEMVIRDVLDGHDVLVQSPTGSGKTLAFGVPIVELLDSNGPKPAALILAPTRELASQIVDEMQSICHARALKIAAVYGGVGINPQIKAVRKAHIVVATPGRLEDLIQRRAIDLGRIRMLVLDEADRMLDMGFKPPVDRIVALLPQKRQTLFFSATLEGAAGKLASAYTYKPATHTHAPRQERKADISHRFTAVGSQASKLNSLLDELEQADSGRTLVFVRTKRGADRLVKKLKEEGVKTLAMHGDKSQAQRQKALARFERGELQTLVATDVAARGIDVAEITHVINFDMPEDGETYTHRTGRTGRAGATGEAVSFVLADQHRDMRDIAKSAGVLDEFHAGAGHGRALEQRRRAQAGRPQAASGRPSTAATRDASTARAAAARPAPAAVTASAATTSARARPSAEQDPARGSCPRANRLRPWAYASARVGCCPLGRASQDRPRQPLGGLRRVLEVEVRLDRLELEQHRLPVGAAQHVDPCRQRRAPESFADDLDHALRQLDLIGLGAAADDQPRVVHRLGDAERIVAADRRHLVGAQHRALVQDVTDLAGEGDDRRLAFGLDALDEGLHHRRAAAGGDPLDQIAAGGRRVGAEAPGRARSGRDRRLDHDLRLDLRGRPCRARRRSVSTTGMPAAPSSPR